MQSNWEKRMAAVALVLAAATVVAANASANRHAGRPGHGSMLGRVEHGVEQLELAPETRKSVDAILDRARTEGRPLREQLLAARAQMRTALDAESPSSDAVLAQADSIGALRTQAKKLELQAIIQVRQLLTAEQWQQLRTQQRPGRACRHGDYEKPS
jgi:Spy/CpxP family protein refolding chaperone